MKNKLFFAFFAFLNQANAMDDIENKINYFYKIPNELHVEIGKSLYEEDFFNFFITCKHIRSNLSHASFMPPEEELLEIIRTTPFPQVYSLSLKWERADKLKSVPLLRSLADKFQDIYPPDDKNIFLGDYSENIETYVKILNILYKMGDKKCETIYKNLVNQIEDKFHSAKGPYEEDDQFDNPDLYIFYYKIFALLNSKVRITLVKDYQNQVEPFKNDTLKIKDWEKPFDLPLSEKLCEKK